MLLALLPRYVTHPLSGQGTAFWGGIGGDLTYLLVFASLTAGLLRGYRQHRCHVARCWRLSWHPDPVHGHPVCKRHHPHAGRCVPDAESGSKLLEE